MKHWVQFFKEIKLDDQRWRSIVTPTLLKNHYKEQQFLDSVNLIKLDSFISLHGWPIPPKAGANVTFTAEMVALHSPVEKMEHYRAELIKIVDSTRQKRYGIVAQLEDRINMYRKRRQVYGTQLFSVNNQYKLYPLFNADSVEVWRKNAGMLSIDFYLKGFNIVWDKDAYKKMLPELIQHGKVSDSTPIRYIPVK
jgi:hypothetical protein